MSLTILLVRHTSIQCWDITISTGKLHERSKILWTWDWLASELTTVHRHLFGVQVSLKAPAKLLKRVFINMTREFWPCQESEQSDKSNRTTDGGGYGQNLGMNDNHVRAYYWQPQLRVYQPIRLELSLPRSSWVRLIVRSWAEDFHAQEFLRKRNGTDMIQYNSEVETYTYYGGEVSFPFVCHEYWRRECLSFAHCWCFTTRLRHRRSLGAFLTSCLGQHC